MKETRQLLRLLQLASPVLPVGAYSYSEGLETLVEDGVIRDRLTLQDWLVRGLECGTVRMEAALMLRGHEAALAGSLERLQFWNQWTTAARETEELRQQSWQMGRTLLQLLGELRLEVPGLEMAEILRVCDPMNFAVAFGVGVAGWQIDPHAAILGYLQTWSTNLINAGVKLIPLGQTSGQQLLFHLDPILQTTTESVLQLQDDDLVSCSWGLSLASMRHETQYTRLFRS